MKNKNKKLVKVLVATILGVGFVTSMMLSNIAEATNFGKGGSSTPIFTVAQIETYSAKNSNTTVDWPAPDYNMVVTSNITNDNCIMINGYRFKVVGNTTTAGKQILTLWSYNSTETGATKSFAKDVKYDADGDWSDDAGTSVSAAEAYNHSTLKTAMDGLLTTDGSGNPNGGELYDSNFTYVKYTSTTDSNVTDAYVWAPSITEVESAAWGDGTNALTYAQRAVGDPSWLRSPDHDDDGLAYNVDFGGHLGDFKVYDGYLLRPALQILNQTSYVFTTNVTIPTNGVFTADGSGTTTNYALNSTATATFDPTTGSGVTLDGTKIGITASTSDDTNYKVAGLLTKDTSGTDTWANLNGTTANIAYMAQASSGTLDLSGVTDTDEYTLKVFGLKTADTTVTELASGAITGLSKGADDKIHMKVSGTVNVGVPVTVSNGAVVDLAGDASNPVTVQETSDAGKLNLGALNYEYSGNITDNGILTVEGTGTLVGTVSGAGKVVIDGIISADANKFNQIGGLEVQDTLAFTSRGLNVAAVGGFKQAAGSNVTVGASKIQADSNDHNQALFTGVDAADKLNVSAGKLTLTGAVQDGKYYVLVAGTAVNNGTVSDATLWKMDNISFPDILMADYEIKYDTNTADNPGSIALHVTNATTKEEGNTSGLAAVQQGNITVAKEISDEVENHLGMIANPKLVDKEKYNKEVWASYIRTKETTEGMKLGAGVEGNNTAQYNGVVVGVDFYTSRKAITGVAFSYTTGDIDSYSGNTFTRNKSKYYGVSFYDRVTNGNTALIYDIGYIKGDNDISQFYNKETTADVKTDTYTAGVRYEAEFGTEKSRVVPFASFRYMRQNNKDYTNSHNTRFEVKNQNLYIPKVGVAWTGDFAMPQCEWTWRPSVEAGYVWNLGNRSADSMVYAGTLVSPIDYDVVDRSSYYAKAGMEFMTKNFTAGLFYRYLKGNAVRNNKWNVNMSWSF